MPSYETPEMLVNAGEVILKELNSESIQEGHSNPNQPEL